MTRPGPIRPVHQRARCYDRYVPRFLIANGFTRVERHAATWRIHEAISACEGAILSATPFSNKAIALTAELPAANVRAFHDRLVTAGVVFYDDTELAYSQLIGQLGDDDNDVVALLNIAFLHDDPDEKTEIPSVPG